MTRADLQSIVDGAALMAMKSVTKAAVELGYPSTNPAIGEIAGQIATRLLQEALTDERNIAQILKENF